MKQRIYLLIISSLFCLLAMAQEYKVRSFEVVPTDLSAKTNSRTDANGQVCALVKVYAADGIAAVRGAVVGDVGGAGMEKWIYLSPNATQMEIVFDNHLPLHIVFDDYYYPSVTGKMTYVLKLNEITGSKPKPVNVAAVRKEAIKAYERGEYQTAYELFSNILSDKEARYYLGDMYEKGLGVDQSDTEAARWYRRAAEQGHALAQNNLGEMYEKGLGVERSDSEAAKWYRMSAEQGYVSAQNNLGEMYEKGRGVEQSDVEAVKWYRKAAEQGNASAQNSLGEMYEKGYGVKKSYSEALNWYRKSAEQGNASAQNNLGEMYRYGRGVKESSSEALNWYRKSAEQGNSEAQYRLDVMYELGKELDRSLREAFKLAP